MVALPGSRSHFQGFPGRYKSDGVTETLSIYRFPENENGEFINLKSFLDHHTPFFSGKGNSAVISLLYSAILTRGIETIKGIFFKINKICITRYNSCKKVGRMNLSHLFSITFTKHGITLNLVYVMKLRVFYIVKIKIKKRPFSLATQ